MAATGHFVLAMSQPQPAIVGATSPVPAIAGQDSIAISTLPPNVQEELNSMNLVDNAGHLSASDLISALQCSKQIAAGSLPLYRLPSEMRSALEKYDTDDSAVLESSEILRAFAALDSEAQMRENGIFRLSNFPEHVREEIRKLDENNDDVLDASEIAEGVKALHREKQKNKQLYYLLMSMIGFLVIFLACTSGVMFAVLEAVKESSISKGGVMTVKGSSNPVLVASADVSVVDGVLSTRCVGQCSNSSQGSIQTSQASFPMKLTSLVDDAYLRELKYMTVGQGDSFVHFQVFAVARYAEKGSRSGSVVVIYTHLGEISIDGEALSFHETISGAFSRAGFLVDPSNGRRLLGLVDVLGFFNKINKILKTVNQSQVSDYPRMLPLTFEARKKRIMMCKEQDCKIDGKLVDWASEVSLGQTALVSEEDLYSLTFDGFHVGKSVQYTPQWPDQTVTTLQNETHNMTFQTFDGINYFCKIQTDDSLKKSIVERRRRAEMTAPAIDFLGFKTVNGIYCRHFQIRNSSIHLYEDYFQNRLYQLQVSSSVIWRFERFVAVTNESSNPLSAMEFNFDQILTSCDPEGRTPPEAVIVGLLSNSVTPKASWGSQSHFSASILNPDYNLTQEFNQTLNASQLNDTSVPHLRYRKKRGDSEFQSELIHVTAEEYNARRHHARRVLGEGCTIKEFDEKSLDLPPMDTPIMKKGKLFTWATKLIFRCKGPKGDEPDLAQGIIAKEMSISKAGGGGCPTGVGTITVYIPTELGSGPAMVQGLLNIEFTLKDCFLGVLPSAIQDLAEYLVEMKAGITLELQYPYPMQGKKCPYSDCYGFVTYADSNCWLKTRAAFDRPGSSALGTTSYIQGDVNAPSVKSFYRRDNTDYGGWDIQYYDGNPALCEKKCYENAACYGFVTFANTRCWLKYKAAFDQPGRAASGSTSYIQKQWFFDKQDNTNYGGQDLQYFNVNPADCENKCHENANCYGFVTFANVNCWLKPKSAFDRPGEASSGTTSYVRKTWFFDKQVNTNYGGFDLQYLNVNPVECERKCNQYASNNGRLGNLPSNLYMRGEGYATASVAFVTADLRIQAVAFRATKCGELQKPGSNLQAGYRIFVDAKVTINAWWWEDEIPWSMNVVPGNQPDYCSASKPSLYARVLNDDRTELYSAWSLGDTKCARS